MTKSENNQNAWEEWKSLENIERGHHQTSQDVWNKWQKSTPEEQENFWKEETSSKK